ncbi:unnamed protein product [Rhizopus stolonifer]
MNEQDIEELLELRKLAQRPLVQKALQDIISKEKREPIKTAKAHVQTSYITSNYGWSQTDRSVTIRISLLNLMQINQEKYDLNVQDRSIELDFNSTNNSAIYKFKLNQLYHFVLSEQSRIKFKEDKVIITLIKQEEGKHWVDLLMKSTHNVYHELERSQKTIPVTKKSPIDTSFFETTDNHCQHQKENTN